MTNQIFLNFNQIIEKLNSQGIEYNKQQIQNIFNIFDIQDEAGTIGVRDNKLTNSELSNFLRYMKENYVEKVYNAFSDITEKLSQKEDNDNMEISADNEFYSSKRSVQLYNKFMPEFNALSSEQKNRVKELLYLEGRGENYQLDDESLLKIGQLSQEEYDKIKEFLIAPGRRPQYNIEEMIELSNIPKEKRHIFNNPDRGSSQISPLIVYGRENDEQIFNSIEQLSSIKVRIKSLLKRSNEERLLESSEIYQIIATFRQEDLNKVITLMQDPTFSSCKIDDLLKVIKLSEEQLERVKEFLQNPPVSKDNIIDGALDLIALTPEELEIAKKYYNIPERGAKQQLTGSGIALVAKLTDEERKFAEENGLIYSFARRRQLSGTQISLIAKMKSDELQEFINKNPNFQFIPSINENAVTLADDKGVEYTFDRNGLVSKKELVSEESLPDGRKSNTYKTTNYRLHTEQETKYVALEKAAPTVYSIQTKYFDENNNLLKTLTLKENNNSSYDASISYPNGEIVPLQHSSYNEETGIGTIERHFVSPQGVKTEYYYEDSVDGTRIVDYTITDADGNILLKEHNTFQQISENEFISSSNDKTYKIEFKDGTIVITDQKSKKTHTINIDNIVCSPEQKNIVINYLKNIPASQLMFLEEQPINLLFDDYLSSADNGSYAGSDKILTLSHPFLDNDLNLFTLTHEWGHYIDLYLSKENGIISSDKLLNEIYQEELENFLKNTNVDEQAGMSYLMQDGISASERVGDANALRYTGKSNMSGIRDFYYQQYFPRTISRIIELIRSEEERVSE